MMLADEMRLLGSQAREASRALARLSTEEKNRCLGAMADALLSHEKELEEANATDLETAKGMGLSAAMLDRLRLNGSRIQGMAQGLREVADLPDPVGRIMQERTLPNGLKLQKTSTPIGVVVIIYESRPNVTADAAGLCFKSGNATILRGGKEALHSNQLIARIMVEAASRACQRFPKHAIQVVPTTDREAIPVLLSLTEYVDLCMPRGGEGLIRAVAECSRVPVIKHYKGVCHVYVDGDADLKMAEEIILNAKCQRPGVCNAAETLLVDRRVAAAFLPVVAARLAEHKVTMHADAAAWEILSPAARDDWRIEQATEEHFHTEYNDLVLNVAVVDGVEGAMAHITRFGSQHSDAIVTANETAARRFLQEVDSAAVYWNASTRFTDGSQFGMGAEIGISTDKIGARGPMGLEELNSYKWQCFGQGHLRT